MEREPIASFLAWAQEYVTGDEKSQAHIFLDRLFQAFGQPGCLDVGGSPEVRVRKAAEDGGGIAFADYVWKPVVLIEMKRRGTDLQKHYRQAFDYWVRLVPNRPRYVILCNFDEFRVYDFQTQMDTPVDTVELDELPDRFGALAFLAPGSPEPTFGDDRVAVTRQAADKLAACFTHLVGRDVGRELAQRFILQTLVALFAEDIGLLDKYMVARLLADCARAEDSYDLLGGLFAAMNSARPVTGGRFKGVPYFNGGLFAKAAAIELDIIELNLLRESAAFDWSKVQPEIFGTLFQHSMAAGERHAFGAHFTHPADIMKIVGPTIVEPWREQIETAKSLRRLRELQDRLHAFRVLDPACGSGNFLYIAYRELKRLEARLFERMDEFRSEAQRGKGRLSYLSAQNFYGMDVLPFAIEIAKVTMMIARKLAIDEMHITENALPLDNLDSNFVAVDALLMPGGIPTPWPKVDVIIGNRRSWAPSVSNPNAARTTSTGCARRTPRFPAWRTTASTGCGKRTITCPPARRTTPWRAGPDSSARRTSATTSRASAGLTTSSGMAPSSRRSRTNRGPAKPMSTSPSPTGSRPRTRPCCRERANCGSRPNLQGPHDGSAGKARRASSANSISANVHISTRRCRTRQT